MLSAYQDNTLKAKNPLNIALTRLILDRKRNSQKFFITILDRTE
jgi:hypothetical protein